MEILNIPIHTLLRKEVILLVERFINDSVSHQIITVNPEFVVEAQRNPYFLEILRSASLNVADGIGLVWLGGIKTGRIAGVDLMRDICCLAMRQNKSCFLFGGRELAAVKAKQKLEKEFPGLKILGTAEDSEEAEMNIKKTKPDIVFVALGAPKQEIWIFENKHKFPKTKLFMGVGGSFDIVSGRLARAPFFMRKIGLEWLWRLAQEPKRLTRIFKAVIIFPLLLFKKKYFKI